MPFSHFTIDGLLVVMTTIIVAVIIAATWMYLVARRTRAETIVMRAFGVEVNINMSRQEGSN